MGSRLEIYKTGSDSWTTETDYAVEYSNSHLDSDWHCKFFKTKDESIDFAEEIGKSFKIVAIYQYAEYENDSGTWVLSWVYFWWSEAKGWGPAPRSGYGRPEQRQYHAKFRDRFKLL